MGRNSSGSGGAGGAGGGRVRLGTRVVSPGELRRVLDLGGQPISATSEARLESVRGLFDSGRQNQGRGVVVAVDRQGRMEVIDGRHRIIVARERGALLKVTFVRGGRRGR